MKKDPQFIRQGLIFGFLKIDVVYKKEAGSLTITFLRADCGKRQDTYTAETNGKTLYDAMKSDVYQ